MNFYYVHTLMKADMPGFNFKYFRDHMDFGNGICHCKQPGLHKDFGKAT